MSEIHLEPKDFAKLPYKGTIVSWRRTKGEIDGLLYDYGIDQIQWTQEGENVTLIFVMEVEVKGVMRTLAFKFEPPRIFVHKRRHVKGKGYVKQPVLMEDTSWRLFFWYLKSKLEACKYGMGTAEMELMSHIVYKLRDDKGVVIGESTVGETMQEIIAKGRLDQIAIEDKREKKAVEVEAREVKG